MKTRGKKKKKKVRKEPSLSTKEDELQRLRQKTDSAILELRDSYQHDKERPSFDNSGSRGDVRHEEQSPTRAELAVSRSGSFPRKQIADDLANGGGVSCGTTRGSMSDEAKEENAGSPISESHRSTYPASGALKYSARTFIPSKSRKMPVPHYGFEESILSQEEKWPRQLREYKRLPKVKRKRKSMTKPPRYVPSLEALRKNQAGRKRDFVAWDAHLARRYAVTKTSEYKDDDELYPAPKPSFGVQSPIKNQNQSDPPVDKHDDTRGDRESVHARIGMGTDREASKQSDGRRNGGPSRFQRLKVQRSSRLMSQSDNESQFNYVYKKHEDTFFPKSDSEYNVLLNFPRLGTKYLLRQSMETESDGNLIAVGQMRVNLRHNIEPALKHHWASIYSARMVFLRRKSLRRLKSILKRAMDINKSFVRQVRLSRRANGWRGAIAYVSRTRSMSKVVVHERMKSSIDRYWDGTAFKMHLLKDLLPKLWKQLILLALKSCVGGRKLKSRLSDRLFLRLQGLRCSRAFLGLKMYWAACKTVENKRKEEERMLMEQIRMIERDVNERRLELKRVQSKKRREVKELERLRLLEHEHKETLHELRADSVRSMEGREIEAITLSRLQHCRKHMALITGSDDAVDDEIHRIEERNAHDMVMLGNLRTRAPIHQSLLVEHEESSSEDESEQNESVVKVLVGDIVSEKLSPRAAVPDMESRGETAGVDNGYVISEEEDHHLGAVQEEITIACNIHPKLPLVESITQPKENLTNAPLANSDIASFGGNTHVSSTLDLEHLSKRQPEVSQKPLVSGRRLQAQVGFAFNEDKDGYAVTRHSEQRSKEEGAGMTDTAQLLSKQDASCAKATIEQLEVLRDKTRLISRHIMKPKFKKTLNMQKTASSMQNPDDSRECAVQAPEVLGKMSSRAHVYGVVNEEKVSKRELLLQPKNTSNKRSAECPQYFSEVHNELTDHVKLFVQTGGRRNRDDRNLPAVLPSLRNVREGNESHEVEHFELENNLFGDDIILGSPSNEQTIPQGATEQGIAKIKLVEQDLLDIQSKTKLLKHQIVVETEKEEKYFGYIEKKAGDIEVQLQHEEKVRECLAEMQALLRRRNAIADRINDHKASRHANEVLKRRCFSFMRRHVVLKREDITKKKLRRLETLRLSFEALVSATYSACVEVSSYKGRFYRVHDAFVEWKKYTENQKKIYHQKIQIDTATFIHSTRLKYRYFIFLRKHAQNSQLCRKRICFSYWQEYHHVKVRMKEAISDKRRALKGWKSFLKVIHDNRYVVSVAFQSMRICVAARSLQMETSRRQFTRFLKKRFFCTWIMKLRSKQQNELDRCRKGRAVLAWKQCTARAMKMRLAKERKSNHEEVTAIQPHENSQQVLLTPTFGRVLKDPKVTFNKSIPLRALKDRRINILFQQRM